MKNRRSFLAAAAATAVSGLAASSCAQGAAKPRNIKKAIMYGTIKSADTTVLGKFKAAKEAGYEGVEAQGGMNQQEVLDAYGQTGLKAASVCCHTHWKDTLTHNDAAVREKGLQGVLQTLRDAKAYGTDSILVVPGVVSEEVGYDVAWERSITQIKKAAPLAKELGVKISIENVWNNFILSPIEAVKFLDEIGDPIVGWHFDIGNVLRYGWPEQWIKVLGKRINRLHIKEFSRKLMTEKGLRNGFDVDLMEGDNNWPAIMKALDDVGYEGWAISEQGIKLLPGGLKSLTERMDKILAM